jgi:integrase
MYRDLRGRKRSAGTFTSEREANRAWQRAEAALALGRIADPRRGRQTVRAYVEHEWFPNHVIEATTRESYRYILDRYLLPALGDLRMADVLPNEVRQWIARLQGPLGVNPPSIVKCKMVLDAIFTTALNDQVVFLHPGKGVKTPPVATRPRRIITADQYARIHAALPDDTARLLVETDVESGLRWGELTELRVKDLDLATGVLTVSRVVVELTMKNRPDGQRFLVKDYPKDRKWRRLRLAPHLATKLSNHIAEHDLARDDLLFAVPAGPRRYRTPDVLPDPATLGWTEPNAKGRRYRHGTPTAYAMARCRCRHCKDAVAAYRAARRAAGKDHPRTPRTIDTDLHISRGWFRKTVWIPALQDANLGFHVTPHGLRHAHASWLLAGGADLQVVKERLGHASITTTEKYLHTLPSADQAALDALATVRRPSQSAGSTSGDRGEELQELRRALAQFRAVFDSLPSP